MSSGTKQEGVTNTLLGGAIFTTLISIFLYLFHVEAAPETVNPQNNVEGNIPIEEFNFPLSANPWSSIQSNGKQFSLQEISQHDTRDDLWIVIYDRVFDVSQFVSEHPGGDEILISHGGLDVTKEFVEVHQDWKKLFSLAKPFYIGDLKKSQ